MAYSTQRKDVAIVGIHEYPKRVVGPGVTANHIRIESARKALDDAGLKWQDVDGFYETGGAGSEYFGFKPNTIDTTSVGGASYEFHAAHAVQAIREGKCRVALLTYGSTAHTDGRAIGTGGFGGFAGPPTMQQNMTAPWGGATAANYALVKTRHMFQYGTKPEQFAEISVATRAHAMRNPEAVQAMKDLAYENIREITIEDVLESRMIADPLHLLECCMVSDGGGAVVIASAEVARNTRKKPVWIIGTGQATKYRENNGDITVSAGAQSAPQAFGEAGIKPEEIDNAQMYGSFTITQLVCMEDLGFCKKGEGGDFVSGGRLRWDTPQKPAMGTDGSGYSSNHPGAHGIFLLLEGTRQLRGESTSQVRDAKLGVAHGNGGDLGGAHSGGTIILARD